MSTKYTLVCSSGDEDATIEITDRINFPGFNDEWRCVEGVAAFGAPGEGKAVDWGRAIGEETTLSTGTASPHRLAGFWLGITKGDSGSGYKSTPDGSFPGGSFEWICVKVV